MKVSDIVGRSAELDAIDRFLDRLEREAAAIVFEGQAGIGKTTVWRQVFERAARRSLAVCRAAPSRPRRSSHSRRSPTSSSRSLTRACRSYPSRSGWRSTSR